MLAFLPYGSARSRTEELLASARTRFELEALAVQRYEQDVLAYRLYLQPPRHDAGAVLPPDQPEPRRSIA